MIIFAPEGMYPPAGMFTIPHLVSLFICLVMIVCSILLFKNISIEQLKKQTFKIAITITILEIIKITYKFVVCDYKFTDFNHWVPLYFCSIFIFASWFSLSKNKFISRMGTAFITCGCLTGGLSFLIVPTTSLQMVPIWHFLSIHSMTFHSLMVYLGFMYIYKGFFNKNSFKYFLICFIVFLTPSLIMNQIFHCNLMLVREPFNMPFKIVDIIYENVPWLYPLLASLVYIFVPYSISYLINKLITKIKENNSTNILIKERTKNSN